MYTQKSSSKGGRGLRCSTVGPGRGAVLVQRARRGMASHAVAPAEEAGAEEGRAGRWEDGQACWGPSA